VADKTRLPACAPLPTDVVAEVGDSGYCLFPCSYGEHIRGVTLSLPQVAELGEHLARLHASVKRTAEVANPPAVPTSVAAEVTDAGRAVRKGDRLAGVLSARGTHYAFDVAAAAAFEERRLFLDKHAHLRPEGGVPAGPLGWMHGDFQCRNLL
jgi:homoserine kinase type II